MLWLRGYRRNPIGGAGLRWWFGDASHPHLLESESFVDPSNCLVLGGKEYGLAPAIVCVDGQQGRKCACYTHTAKCR